MVSLLGHFRDDEAGATAIEYALIGSLMVAAVVSGARIFSDELQVIFDYIATEFSQASARSMS